LGNAEVVWKIGTEIKSNPLRARNVECQAHHVRLLSNKSSSIDCSTKVFS